MARAPKNGSSGPTKVVATTLLMPGEGVIPRLAKAKEAARKQASSASGVFSDKFSKAQEKDHVDRRAANIAFGLDALDDKTLHVTYFHLLRYMDDLGIPKRATQQNELFESGETGPGLKGDDEGDEQPDNVTSIGRAARRVAESAGTDAS